MTYMTRTHYSETNKRIHAPARKIRKTLRDFDHSFDNTVVDSHAFYSVMNSDVVINDIIQNHNTSNYSDSLTNLVMTEVDKIYKKYNRKAVKSDLYHLYIENILRKLEI